MKKLKNLKYYIILNLIILVINILYLKNINNNSLLTKPNFKSVDKIILYFNKRSFKEISYDINKQFISKIRIIRILLFERLFKPKKTLILYFVDNHNHYNYLLFNILKKKYNIKLSSQNPDYLIYNIFGCNHLNNGYNNSIKIAFFTENQIPDFNIADYAISHSHINYLDRHFNFKYYFLNYFNYFNISFLNIIRKRVIKSPIRRKFCAAVISNFKKSNNFRLEFIKQLNKYKTVDMGGKYNNNIGVIKNKIEFLSNYKFSIAMENTEGDGYSSEKILESFLSGTIPIYYGNYMIDEYINPKSFILIRGEEDLKEKIEYIKKIDNDNELYLSILKQNILMDNNIIKKNYKEFKKFIYHIFEQNKNGAKRTSSFL